MWVISKAGRVTALGEETPDAHKVLLRLPPGGGHVASTLETEQEQ